MNLTKEEKADRYDSLQTAIKWTIEQYRKKKTELENDAGKGRIPLLAAFNAGKIAGITEAIEGMGMNKDINKTLYWIIPVLNMNGEKVESIEAVHNWYHVGDREYMKEVAEITYENGHRKYADIGSDSNLTAVYDVIAVIQQLKPESEAIERIERGVYEPYEPPKSRTEEEIIREYKRNEAFAAMGW